MTQKGGRVGSNQIYYEEGSVEIEPSEALKKGEGAELANAMVSQVKLRFLLTLPVEPMSSNAASVADNGKTLEWVLITGENNHIYAEARVPNLTNIAMAIALGAAIIALLTVILVRRLGTPRGQSV